MRTRRALSSSDPVPSTIVHRSVLLHEAIEGLEIRPDDIIVDATLGGAGHARAIAEKLDASGTFIGFDLDHDAIERAQILLKDAQAQKFCIEDNFRDIKRALNDHGIEKIDKALFDLGWSGYQLASGRGFSFLSDEPLLMTYAKELDVNSLTAAKIVNTWQEESIADVIYGWGDERYSRRIAKAIVERRSTKRFEIASDLAEVIKASVPAVYRHGRIHPATKTFQALRIAVNDELGALKQGITDALDLLASNGRVAVITFHSIEDRAVKELFLEQERIGIIRRITHSPLKPSASELKENPRARSAKLRIVEKI